MRHSLLLTVVLVLAVAACTPPKPATPASSVVRYSTDTDFETVRDEVQQAIQAKGLVIDHTSYVGKMLDRTRKDVGSDKVLFNEARAQAFTFCSATISRKTMEADAHNIAFCPYAIVVYSTAAEPKKTYAAFRRPVLSEGSEPAKASLKEVEMLLDGIVREGLRIKQDMK